MRLVFIVIANLAIAQVVWLLVAVPTGGGSNPGLAPENEWEWGSPRFKKNHLFK
jgi:hypothetical protein